MTKKMALSEFVTLTQPAIEAFSAATQEQIKADPKNFDRKRTELDWWREVAAYMVYVELEESSR